MANTSERKASRNKLNGKYVRQRIRTTRNKARARKRHLDKHPNDKQAKINLAGKDF